MIQGQRLQEVYNDFIYKFSSGLKPKSIQNKKDILDGLIPFLNGRPFDHVTANEYAMYKFAHGWNMPNSQVNILKYLKAFINFLLVNDHINKD
ncbi:MAG: hypothetical protein KGJ07_07690, partial [Patescibacteria group bacterium]|nr:hypothetical protein [Patescibacteria group bacterium]